MSNGWYPILFSPIYKEYDWGGELLKGHYGRSPTASMASIGESYELIDREELQSVVENGNLKGKTLRELIQLNPAGFIGSKHAFTKTFPLLIKFIDAGKRQPLQVHPDHIMSERIENARPNSKMWYVITSQPDAKILVGIKRNCTQQQFLSRVGTPEIESVIQSFPSQPSDAYFIPGGRIHAADAGNLIFSVEQNNGTTILVSHWGLYNSKNEIPSSKLKLALRCIHFQDRTLARIRGESSFVNRNRKIPMINACPFFAIDDIRLVYELHDHTDCSTFHLLTAIDNEIILTTQEHTVEVKKGRSCYIPASLGQYSIKPIISPTRLLKTTLRID